MPGLATLVTLPCEALLGFPMLRTLGVCTEPASAVPSFSDAPGVMEERVSPTLVVESMSEEPLGAELQKVVETCHEVPDGASCPKIHSRRFRE